MRKASHFIYMNYYQIASYLLLFNVILVFVFRNFIYNNAVPSFLAYSFWFFLGAFLCLSLMKYLEKKIGVERTYKRTTYNKPQ